MYFYCYVYIFLLYVYVSSSCQLTLSVYPSWGFSVPFPQLYGKWRHVTRKDGARPVLFQNFCVLCIFLCRSVYCLCVDVYNTTATGWQSNWILTNISCLWYCISHVTNEREMFLPVYVRREIFLSLTFPGTYWINLYQNNFSQIIPFFLHSLNRISWCSSCGTWWHKRRNQISSFPETDESI